MPVQAPELRNRKKVSRIINSSSISRLLYWLQLASAAACVILSLTRLIQQNYGNITLNTNEESTKKNRRPALNIFYSLAFSEALLFLTERAYWEWQISCCHLLNQVNRDCDLGPTGPVSVRRFFYDAYSRCINGSIFDGIKMDMVSFGEELLVSNSRDEELIGARILLRFADEGVRRIGSSIVMMERLVEMLSWRELGEEEIRRAAAVVVSKLVGTKHNGIRVARIDGAMEAISSLLYDNSGGIGAGQVDEIILHQTTSDQSENNLLGLLILKKLAKDPQNCIKIGKTKDLIPKIINFITKFSQNPHQTDPQIQSAKRALQILKSLAGTTGRSGAILRREISQIVFTFSSIREILIRGGATERKLAVEVITSLAIDEAARESIGATGGMLRELMKIFLNCRADADADGSGEEGRMRVEAGEAVAMIVVENEKNCRRVLRIEENVVKQLVEAVRDPLIGLKACRILNYLCAYANEEDFVDFERRKEIVEAFPMVINDLIFPNTKQLEASIGLAVQIFRFMSSTKLIEELDGANISEIKLIKSLVCILQKYNYPSIKTPSIRRYVIDISIWLMQSNEKYIQLFNICEMAKELQIVAETTTELECFIAFSGYVGIIRHKTAIESLVDNALELLGKDIIVS